MIDGNTTGWCLDYMAWQIGMAKGAQERQRTAAEASGTPAPSEMADVDPDDVLILEYPGVDKAHFAKRNAQPPSESDLDSGPLLSKKGKKKGSIGSETMLGEDSFNSIAQGLKLLFEENGHKGPWIESSYGGGVLRSGNPMEENRRIVKLRGSHKTLLAKAGKCTQRASALSTEYILALSKKFFLIDDPAVEDTRLHSIITLGVYCGLRSDGLAKLDYENVTCVGGLLRIDLTKGTKRCDMAKR